MNDSLKIQLDLYGQLTIEPKGRSMLPFLKEKRDAVIITIPRRPIKKYDVVLYKHGDVYVLHRVIKIEKNFLTICGDNSNISEIVKNEKIIGVVSEILHNGKKINADCLCLNLCIRLWYGLGIKKAIFIYKRGLKRYKRVGHNEENNKSKNKEIHEVSRK